MSFASSITIDALERDPYPIYARLRREEPVVHVPVANCWFATRWADIEQITRNPALFTAEAAEAPVNEAFGRPNILTSEGDTHKELRDGVEPHYRPRPVAAYIESLVRPIVEEQLRSFLSSGSDDLVADYFEPVSCLALARSFGFLDVDVPTLRRWFYGLSQGAINFERDPARAAICTEVCAEIDAVVLPLLEQLATNPNKSPLSHMLHSGMPEGQVRPPERILPTVRVALLGGMQEPGHGAASTLVGLLTNPDQFADVKSDIDKLLVPAIDEGLRWVAPIGTQMRTAREDCVVGDTQVQAGTPISCILASANRDETRFTDPDKFDIHRPRASVASFGFGAHFCAGKWFARAQIELALRHLLATLPDLRLAGDPPEFRGWEFRAPTSLRIAA